MLLLVFLPILMECLAGTARSATLALSIIDSKPKDSSASISLLKRVKKKAAILLNTDSQIVLKKVCVNIRQDLRVG